MTHYKKKVVVLEEISGKRNFFIMSINFKDLDSNVNSYEDKGENWKFLIFNMPKKMANYKRSRRLYLDCILFYVVCKGYMTSVRENPELKLNDIREKTQKKWNTGITKVKAFMARNRVKNMVDGSFKEQYIRIYHYTH
ncbi:hypothetical protein CR513_32933, partial [Mucuna pruriens]